VGGKRKKKKRKKGHPLCLGERKTGISWHLPDGSKQKIRTGRKEGEKKTFLLGVHRGKPCRNNQISMYSQKERGKLNPHQKVRDYQTLEKIYRSFSIKEQKMGGEQHLQNDS